MNMLLKLALPIVLGIIAAGLNWYVLKEKTAPAHYLKVKQQVKAGDRFTEENLEVLEVPRDEGSLKETAVPYKHRAILFNSPSLRDLTKGDLVLWRDVSARLEPGEDQLPVALEGVSVVHSRLLVVGNEVTFVVAAAKPVAAKPASTEPAAGSELRYVGPFRILSVDGSMVRKETDRSRERLITVAIHRPGANGQPDEKTSQLLEAIRARKDGQQRFVEIVLNTPRRP